MAMTTKVSVPCESCGRSVEKRAGEVNRARKVGYGLYCNRKCAGLGRRVDKTPEQLRVEKAEYDRAYRAKNRALLKAKKAAYFQKTYDPEAARVKRRANMPRHVEYCRRPEYRAKKREYDRELRAREYGEWGEAFMVLMSLQSAVRRAEPDAYERRKARGYYLRTSQTRRREDVRSRR